MNAEEIIAAYQEVTIKQEDAARQLAEIYVERINHAETQATENNTDNRPQAS